MSEREEGDGEKARERDGKGRRDGDEGNAVAPTGLLVSNVIYLPCTRIKNLHYCATMLRRRALLPNRDLQLGIAANPWRRMVHGYGHRSFSLVSRFLFSSIIDHPRGLANTPVIFPPFRISLYYFPPAHHRGPRRYRR